MPFPSFGAYTGYSVALNTATPRRRCTATPTATCRSPATPGRSRPPRRPERLGEANGSPPDPDNPGQGSHAAPRVRRDPVRLADGRPDPDPAAIPGRPGLTHVAGRFIDFHTVIYIGRGVPDAWIAPGQDISVSNLTASYDVNTGRRATYRVDITTRTRARQPGRPRSRWTGQAPASNMQVQLPGLRRRGRPPGLRRQVRRGHPLGHAWTRAIRTAIIQLGNAGRPVVDVQVASTVPGQHTQPAAHRRGRRRPPPPPSITPATHRTDQRPASPLQTPPAGPVQAGQPGHLRRP